MFIDTWASGRPAKAAAHEDCLCMPSTCIIHSRSGTSSRLWRSCTPRCRWATWACRSGRSRVWRPRWPWQCRTSSSPPSSTTDHRCLCMLPHQLNQTSQPLTAHVTTRYATQLPALLSWIPRLSIVYHGVTAIMADLCPHAGKAHPPHRPCVVASVMTPSCALQMRRRGVASRCPSFASTLTAC